MNINQEIFAVKLYEMEQEYGKLQSRIRICGQEDHDKILEELKKTTDEYKEYSLILQKSAENSRSPAVAELSRAQLEYSWKMEQLLKGELEKEMHSEGNSLPEDKAEAITLYSEYALDLASQAMRYALIASLSAMDLQLKAEEQKN